MEKIAVAKILKSQGLKGEVKINAYNKNDSALKQGLTVYLKDGSPLFIRSFNERKGFFYVTFENYNSIEQVESLKNEELFINTTDLNKLNKDEYYVKDLLGCLVITNTNKELGIVTEIENFGSADIYTVKNKQQEILFALVEGLFLSVDLQKKQIIVDENKLNEVIV